MGNEHMAGEAAIGIDAEVAMGGAQVFFTSAADGAGAAADPGIHGDAAADRCAVGFVAGAFDHAGDFVSERERQSAILGDIEPPLAAELEITVLQMQVGMTHATTLDPYQHFAATWRRTIDHGLAERLSVGDQRLAVHLSHLGSSLSIRVGAGIIMPQLPACGERARESDKIPD